jgi:hypothetical protein
MEPKIAEVKHRGKCIRFALLSAKAGTPVVPALPIPASRLIINIDKAEGTRQWNSLAVAEPGVLA